MLTSLFYVTGECYRFLHQDEALTEVSLKDYEFTHFSHPDVFSNIFCWPYKTTGGIEARRTSRSQ